MDKALSTFPFPHLKIRTIIYPFRVVMRWEERTHGWERGEKGQSHGTISTRSHHPAELEAPQECIWSQLHLSIYYTDRKKCLKKKRKEKRKHSLPDYAGTLLGIRGDDLEKQFHRSIDSQHGSRGHWERQKHNSYGTTWTKRSFQHYRVSLKAKGGSSPSLPKATSQQTI